MYRILLLVGILCEFIASFAKAQTNSLVNVYPSIVQLVSEENFKSTYPNTAGTRNTFFVSSDGRQLQQLPPEPSKHALVGTK
jgi:hypothetical protein